MSDEYGLRCSSCRTPSRCEGFGCAMVSSMIWDGKPRDKWVELKSGVLSFVAQYLAGSWTPGGRHGADCDGGPAHGLTALIMPHDTDSADPTRIYRVEGYGGVYVGKQGKPSWRTRYAPDASVLYLGWRSET